MSESYRVSPETLVFQKDKPSTHEVQIELIDPDPNLFVAKYCNLPSCFVVDPPNMFMNKSCRIKITYDGLLDSAMHSGPMWIKFIVNRFEKTTTVLIKFDDEDSEKDEKVEEYSRQKLEGHICKICFQQFSEDDEDLTPRILSGCGHTLCEKCVKTMLHRSTNRTITCPFDRKKTKAENSATGTPLENVPKNYALIEMLQKEKIVEKIQDKGIEKNEDPEVPCYEDPNHEATCHCTNCKEDFCQACFTSAHTPKIFSSHQKVPISEKPILLPNCPKHPDSAAFYLCKDQNCTINSKLFCVVCSLGDHLNHECHNIHDILTKNQKDLEKMLESIKSHEKSAGIKWRVARTCKKSFGKRSSEYEEKEKEIRDYYQKKQEEDIKKLEKFADAEKKEWKIVEKQIGHHIRSMAGVRKEIEKTLKMKEAFLNVEELMGKGQAMCSLRSGNDKKFARLSQYTYSKASNADNVPSTSSHPNQKRKRNDDDDEEVVRHGLKKMATRSNSRKQN